MHQSIPVYSSLPSSYFSINSITFFIVSNSTAFDSSKPCTISGYSISSTTHMIICRSSAKLMIK
ncbi:hypothetical protein FQ488_02075 [Enterococcus hirae]|nr:hypothetical protein FQ488_02075 [Enterococcus hirae]